MSGASDAAEFERSLKRSYESVTHREDGDMTELINAHLDELGREPSKWAKPTIRARRAVLVLANSKPPKGFPRGIGDVSGEEIEAWLDNPTWARWTAHTYLGHLKGFYRWAYAAGEMSADPTMGIRAPSGLSRPNPLSASEVRILLTMTCEPWYSCVMLGVGAGLRASELAAIRREDVTAETVHVRCGKGGKERYVVTSAALWTWARDKPAGLLVRRPNGLGVTGKYLSCRQWEYWPSIGLQGMYLHRLRHTFCTTMWQARKDPLVIRDSMGHVSLATTQLYAVPAQDAFRDAISAIDDLLRKHQPDDSRLVPPAAA